MSDHYLHPTGSPGGGRAFSAAVAEAVALTDALRCGCGHVRADHDGDECHGTLGELIARGDVLDTGNLVGDPDDETCECTAYGAETTEATE